MKYSVSDAIYRPAFLIYDLATEQLVVLCSTDKSFDLTDECRIDFKLDNTNVLPRDVYSCNIISHSDSIHFIFF